MCAIFSVAEREVDAVTAGYGSVEVRTLASGHLGGSAGLN
jgi:hypothetical protein